MEDMDKLISKETSTTILENYLGTLDGVNFISSAFESISNDVEGFMGEHNKLIITYDVNGVQKYQKFFVKSKPIKSQAQEEIVDSLGMYKRELFLYDFLLKEYKRYGYDISFAGVSYLCIPEKLLIMEDLTLQGYSLIERGTVLTMEQLKSTLLSLAQYHAAGYAYQKEKTKELNREYILGEEYRELDEFFMVQYIDPTKRAMQWWHSLDRTLNAIIPLLPQNDTYKQEFLKLIKEAEFGKAFICEKSINKTSCHGDLWSNNILFKEEHGVTHCCLVDFQACRYGMPCYDVLLAIICNTDKEFRRQHLEELYLYYHNTLTVILKNYGHDVKEIYPREVFLKNIDLVKSEAIMQVILTRAIVLLPKDNLNSQMTAQGDEGVVEILFNNTHLIVDAYQKYEEYRKDMNEIFYELRESLLVRRRHM